MEPIELEAKSDRELLIQVVGKVNEISRDIKEVCSRADKADVRVTTVDAKASKLAAQILVLQSRVDNHAKYMGVIFGFQ